MESLVSSYERRFPAQRNSKRENTIDEMEIAHNGPLANGEADPLIERAIDKMFAANAQLKRWHFVKDGTINSYTNADASSVVVSRIGRERSRFSVM